MTLPTLRVRWRSLAAVGAAVVSLAAFPVSLAACGDGGHDDVETATELIDTLLAGWSESDPDAVESVFADGAPYFAFNGITYRGDAIGTHVREVGDFVENAIRVGELEEVEEKTYSVPVEFDLSDERVRGTVEFTVDGDLISVMLWTQDPEPIGE